MTFLHHESTFQKKHLTRYNTSVYFIKRSTISWQVHRYVMFETKRLLCEDETSVDLIQNNFMKIQIRL